MIEKRRIRMGETRSRITERGLRILDYRLGAANGGSIAPTGNGTFPHFRRNELWWG